MLSPRACLHFAEPWSAFEECCRAPILIGVTIVQQEEGLLPSHQHCFWPQASGPNQNWAPCSTLQRAFWDSTKWSLKPGVTSRLVWSSASKARVAFCRSSWICIMYQIIKMVICFLFLTKEWLVEAPSFPHIWIITWKCLLILAQYRYLKKVFVCHKYLEGCPAQQLYILVG